MKHCAQCGKELDDRFWQDRFCSSTCSNRYRAAEMIAVRNPDHGHLWDIVCLPPWILDDDGDDPWWCWRCERCGDYVAAHADVEAFTYDCEAQARKAA